eukprot:1177096-Prorocentrum_minimum.AAC.1
MVSASPPYVPGLAARSAVSASLGRPLVVRAPEPLLVTRRGDGRDAPGHARVGAREIHRHHAARHYPPRPRARHPLPGASPAALPRISKTSLCFVPRVPRNAARNAGRCLPAAACAEPSERARACAARASRRAQTLTAGSARRRSRRAI